MVMCFPIRNPLSILLLRIYALFFETFMHPHSFARTHCIRARSHGYADRASRLLVHIFLSHLLFWEYNSLVTWYYQGEPSSVLSEFCTQVKLSSENGCSLLFSIFGLYVYLIQYNLPFSLGMFLLTLLSTINILFIHVWTLLMHCAAHLSFSKGIHLTGTAVFQSRPLYRATDMYAW